jgi:CRISPR-associated protein Cas1
MKRIYILENGSYIRKDGDYLKLMKANRIVEEIPLANLEHLTLIGYTSLSGAVLNTLFNHRVETVLLDPKGRFRGKICLDEHKHVRRRMAQYIHLDKQEFIVRTAGFIVAAKLRNQARFLALRGQKLKNQTLLNIAAAIRTLASEIKNINDLELIRGMEGHGSKLYFQAFPHLILNPEFEFQGRNRRPPRDPVNALLSFVYTLLTNEVLTAIKIAGLDPYLGALHAIEYGRPSLACDLVEEWRTFLGDRLVLALINRKAIGKNDFVYRDIDDLDFVDEIDLKQKRPVEMKPHTCRALLKAYEKWMQKQIKDINKGDRTSHRNMILRQIRRFEKYLLGVQQEYQPFSWSQER